MCKKELLEVEKEIKKLSKKVTEEKFFLRLNIRVPILREFEKNLSLEKVEKWDYIWNQTKYFEVMSLALYHYQRVGVTKKDFSILKTWLERCHCWEHSDDLSKIFARVVEKKPGWILPTLKKWNRSKNLWERRQSIVSLIEYSRLRERVLPFKDLIKFVDQLLLDKEYYVQKGLGWTLREIYNVYPEKALAYFKSHLEEISPIAYSAATEKVPAKIKRNLNKKRRALRKAN